jgi:hypothetical protein
LSKIEILDSRNDSFNAKSYQKSKSVVGKGIQLMACMKKNTQNQKKDLEEILEGKEVEQI